MTFYNDITSECTMQIIYALYLLGTNIGFIEFIGRKNRWQAIVEQSAV